MLDYLIITPNVILQLINNFLTNNSIIFTFFVSDFFFIIVIALGYWFKLQKSLFIHLGFLIPFSILLNCVLKVLFKIPRLGYIFDVISKYDQFCFPSCDAQISTVFWVTIALNVKNSLYRYLCFLPIIVVIFSRVYLGVHNIYDVFFGFLVGFITTIIWNRAVINGLIQAWYEKKQQNFWLLTAVVIVIYIPLSKDLPWSHTVSISIGNLIGYNLSLPYIKGNITSLIAIPKVKRFLALVLALMFLILIIRFTPIFENNPILYHISVVGKYCLIVFSVYVLIPKMLKVIFANRAIYVSEKLN